MIDEITPSIGIREQINPSNIQYFDINKLFKSLIISLKMANNRNRTAGHNLERDIVNEIKTLGYNVVTARAESRNMDNKKVDVFSPLGVDNSLPYYIQCKNSKSRPNYHDLITTMPQDRIPIVIHRQTHKANTRFVTDGDYVIMRKEDFYNLINKGND